MLYDISTFDKCFETMEYMTDFKYWRNLFDVYLYRYVDEPERMKTEMMDKYNIRLKKIPYEEISFVLQHVTTSADNCESIRKNGIHDLGWTYSHRTELREFLDKHDIILDVEGKHLYQHGEEKQTQILKKNSMVWYKFFDDPFVCGNFQIDKEHPYGGNVHLRPEIIYNIDSVIDGNIEYEWIETHKAYIVFTKASLIKMKVFLCMNPNENNLLDKLFSYAFNSIFYNDISSDRIGILERNEFIPPSDILRIESW